MLFNKRLLQTHLNSFDFPENYDFTKVNKIIGNWQKAIKDGNYEKTNETKVQASFLNRFFNVILGYAEMHDNPDEWFLINEAKTDLDGTKADGALGYFSKEDKKNVTRAVIELKDAKTPLDKKQSSRKDYDSPISQAFSYSSKFDRCDWIIVSNFKEIRLYHKDRGQGYYESFQVLDLHEEKEFKRFYFLLCKENLLDKDRNSLLDKLVKDTSKNEEEISKQFYNDFKTLRKDLFKHICEHNQNTDKICLLEKTQKLLDRFIFVFFCEDSANLLPAQITKKLYESAINSFDMSDQKVWNQFKGLFISIDKGNKNIKPPINAYNGGLFAFDEILDNLIIKDAIWEKVVNLSDYDFESDLNVNILGHIFEQSLNDLEQLKAEIGGIEQDKKKSKRKKDGIFYTPEYITRYIVEQTVGKYLEENPDKLETIKILDPACGSGAFINQAHSFLKEQYQVRHEEKLLNAKENKTLNMFEHTNIAETDRSILLNNIFGVDLNEESTEITKLALWLKTAKKDQPLQNLDNNIKCGNSLINDVETAGNKAFNWNENFPAIFSKKELNAFHITWATHNSRYSERMNEYNVKTGEPILFDEKDEVLITEIIAKIVKEDNLKILAYNICKDHIHMVLVCEDAERDNIVRKLKGKCTQLYKQKNNIIEEYHLWAQKYHSKLIENDETLENTLLYIVNNRLKHELPENIGLKQYVDTTANSLSNKETFILKQDSAYNKGLQPLVTNIDDAFTPQYTGGFDCIIGNPPYVNGIIMQSNIPYQREWLKCNYKYLIEKWDLYLAFIEKSMDLLKESGYLSFIIPDSFLTEKYSSKLRDFIINHYRIVQIDYFPDIEVFENVGVRSIIFVLQKSKSFLPINKVKHLNLSGDKISNKENTFENVWSNFDKLNINLDCNNFYTLGDICFISKGIVFNADEIKYRGEFKKEDLISNIESVIHNRKLIQGEDIVSYFIKNHRFVEWNTDRVPLKISRPTFPELHVENKIVTNKIGELKVAFDEYGYISEQTVRILMKWHQLSNVNNKSIINSIKKFSNYSRLELENISSTYDYMFLLGILNSKLIAKLFDYYRGNGSLDINPLVLRELPIPKSTQEQQESLIKKAEKMIELNKQLHKQTQSALNLIQAEYQPKKISQKLEKFYTLGVNPFMEELKKQGVTLSLAQKQELIEWYNSTAKKLNDKQNEINALDRSIDLEVYKLYDLTDEEIKIIEKN